MVKVERVARERRRRVHQRAVLAQLQDLAHVRALRLVEHERIAAAPARAHIAVGALSREEWAHAHDDRHRVRMQLHRALALAAPPA